MAGYYDPKKDYSVAIEQAKAKGQDTTKLEQERANKIADKYGGKEPTMYGSNQTYSQLSGSNASSSNQQIVRDAVNTANSGKNANVVAQMETAAQKGDWDLVGSLANQLATPDGYYGGENLAYANEVFNNLSKKYGYNANDYYGKKYDSVYGQGAWNSGTGTPVYNGTQTSVVPENEAYGSFDQFLDQMGYDTYADQTQNAIRAAVQQAILGYQGQIEDTNEDSEELARQAYINMMLGGKNLDQQMAAGGYAGGMADSQRIALQANYENNLNQLERQRAATVDELQRAITNAQLTGDMQTAQELSNYLQQVQSQWANYVQYQQSLANDNYWRQQSLAAENQSAARDMALAIIQSGSMPDDETLSAAGISRTQAQALLGTTGQTIQATTGRTGGGYNNGSLSREQVMQMQQALGVTADGLWGSESSAEAGGLTADEAWTLFQQQGNGMTLNDLDLDQITNGSSANGVMLARTDGKGVVFTPWAELEGLMASGKVYVRQANNGKYTLTYNV